MGGSFAISAHMPQVCSRNSSCSVRCRTRVSLIFAQATPHGSPPSWRRRHLVLLPGLLFPALALQPSPPARAEEIASTADFNSTSSSSSPENAETSAEAAREVAGPSFKNYVARDFSFAYPPSLKVIEEDLFAVREARPRSTLDAPVDNPLKAQLVSEDGQQRVSVVVRLASVIKPTFTQLTDISQWGSPKDVARLLLPPGAAVASYSVTSIPQPPRETGTVFGAIKRDPVNLYRYEVLLPDQSQVSMSVGAQKGQVYVLGASALKSQWQQHGAELQQCAETFRLINR